jgi:hypothetical protein
MSKLIKLLTSNQRSIIRRLAYDIAKPGDDPELANALLQAYAHREGWAAFDRLQVAIRASRRRMRVRYDKKRKVATLVGTIVSSGEEEFPEP